MKQTAAPLTPSKPPLIKRDREATSDRRVHRGKNRRHRKHHSAVHAQKHVTNSNNRHGKKSRTADHGIHPDGSTVNDSPSTRRGVLSTRGEFLSGQMDGSSRAQFTEPSRDANSCAITGVNVTRSYDQMPSPRSNGSGIPQHLTPKSPQRDSEHGLGHPGLGDESVKPATAPSPSLSWKNGRPSHSSKEVRDARHFWSWDVVRQRWVHRNPDGSMLECPDELD